MKIVNKSRKIIHIAEEVLLPGKKMELPKGMETHPTIINYFKKGVIVDLDSAVTPSSVSKGISDEERAKIAEEAVAQYKKELEKKLEAQTLLEAEIKAVKGMRKDELAKKAMAMGLDVADSDTTDVLREKIIGALSK